VTKVGASKAGKDSVFTHYTVTPVFVMALKDIWDFVVLYLKRVSMRKPSPTLVAIAIGVGILVSSCLPVQLTAAQSQLTTYHGSARTLHMTHYRDSKGGVHISLRGPFVGRQLFSFRDNTLQSRSIPETHLSGVNRSRGIPLTTSSATLSVFDGRVFLFSTLRRKGRAFSFMLPGTSAIPVQAISRSYFAWSRPGQSKECGTTTDTIQGRLPNEALRKSLNTEETDHRVAAQATPSSQFSMREVEMGIFYDSPVADGGMERTAQHLSAAIFAANELYLRRVGVRVRVSQLLPLGNHQSIISTTSPERLLESFRTQIVVAARKADLFHLFTVAQLDSGTAGVAYVAAACAHRGSYAVGLSRLLNPALQAIVFSHEVLHGLGAEHDDGPHSLMYPVLTTNNNRLSRQTRDSISRFITRHGSCITAPHPLAATINSALDDKQFSATISIQRPPPTPCTVSFQGRLFSSHYLATESQRTIPWRTIVHSLEVAASPLNRQSLRFSAPAPILSNNKKEYVQLRALVQCGRLVRASRPHTLTLMSPSPIGAEEINSGDWIDQLSGTVQVEPG
jgi:hypothetical protein